MQPYIQSTSKMTHQYQSEVTPLNEALEPYSSQNGSPYYLILKDNVTNSVSYSFCGCWSDEPYTGFKHELPFQFKEIVGQLLLEKSDTQADFREYAHSVSGNGKECGFLVTQTKQSIIGKEIIQYLIRPTEVLNPIIEACNKQLNQERKLNMMNCRCISSVSHDFRTPLSIIYANLQLLEYHEFQLDQETIEDAFSLSRMAVKSLLRVLDKVTVVDSINKGRLEYKPTIVNLRSICDNLVRELNEAEVLPDRVKYIHDDSIGEIQLDAYLFGSLFTHLIFNALSYSKKNHNVLFESLAISPNHIRFKVQDQGIGLNAEQLEALRVYFGSIDNKDEGIGLGLAIVRECLFLLKGTLTINSEAGKGSIFIIDLPVNNVVEERGKNEHAD